MGKVIVFGGSGFLGSHVADELDQKGFEVLIIDTVPSPYLKGNQKMVLGSLTDFKLIQKQIKGANYIYNFAAIADLDDANKNPLKTLEINILGNATILEAIKNAPPKRYIFASTVYVYSNQGGFYKVSKQACELCIEEYSRQYNVPYSILRYGSLYGPRTNETNNIHRMIKEALSKGEIRYYGDGEEIREYIHVEDAARCSVEILNENFINQNIILAGNQTIKSKDLLIMINEILGNKIKIHFAKGSDNFHYEITPYSYVPKIGKKYVSNYYLDMGQGLLQCIEEIDKSLK